MKHAFVAGLFLSLLAAGCTKYTVWVRLFDKSGRPVMEHVAIAVEGKYIAGYTERGGEKEPLLKPFYAVDEFTTGELIFGVYGLPDTFRVSFSAPGFYKLVGKARRVVHPDGFVSYSVEDASSPYSPSDVRVSKKGKTIYIDGMLEQTRRGGYGRGY